MVVIELIASLIGLLLLQDEILVSLMNAVFLGRTFCRHGFEVEQAVEVAIRFIFKLLGEPIDRFDLSLQHVLQLRPLGSLVSQAIVYSLHTGCAKLCLGVGKKRGGDDLP